MTVYSYGFECEQTMCSKLDKFYTHNVEQEKSLKKTSSKI